MHTGNHGDFYQSSDGVKYLARCADWWNVEVFLVHIQSEAGYFYLCWMDGKIKIIRLVIFSKPSNYISFRKALDEIFQWVVECAAALKSVFIFQPELQPLWMFHATSQCESCGKSSPRLWKTRSTRFKIESDNLSSYFSWLNFPAESDGEIVRRDNC